jgi:light-harvesting complex I chlorophyll a/b binding protein 1
LQPGVLIPEALGLGNWVSAQKWAATPNGQATYFGAPVPWGTLPIILAVEFLAIAFVESKRNEEQDFEKRKYPGGAFDPLGFSKDPKKLEEYKLKEIKNGEPASIKSSTFLPYCLHYYFQGTSMVLIGRGSIEDFSI